MSIKQGSAIIAGAGGGIANYDNKSITENLSAEIQTVGVINSRDSSTAIKTWTGTRQQYDAIASKDANTLYNITDDTDVSLTILEALYPVGSIYIGTMSTCPLAALFGTWTLVSQDRVLQGAGTRGAVGTTINESLPNIKGVFTSGNNGWENGTGTGAFSSTSDIGHHFGGANGGGKGIIFNASNSSSTYQDNAPVQQNAYLVNIWERTA